MRELPELPDAVGDLVGGHRPDAVPPFEGLVRRRRRRRRALGMAAVVAAASPALALALTSGGGGGDKQVLGGEPPAVAQELLVRVQYEPSTYDSARDQAVLDECAALPGVTGVQQAESYPPQVSLRLTGTAEQNAAVVDCLKQRGTAQVTARQAAAGVSRSGVTKVHVCPVEDRGTGARCRDASDPLEVDRLVELLEADRAPARTCQDRGRQVAVELESANATTVYVDECGNATEGATRFSVAPEARDAVFSLLDTAVEVSTSIFVTFDPATYRPGGDQGVSSCFGLPGVVSGSATSSSHGSAPPAYTLFVAGSRAQLQSALDCARANPSARVSQASPPVPATFTVFENPKPEDTTVALNVFEQSCASGVSATGRVPAPHITYGRNEIRVAISVTPVAGDARCPSNPATFYVLELGEPVGGRRIIDENAS